MKSRTTGAFRAAFARLPRVAQDQCRDSYKLFVENPRHPGLRFKKVHSSLLIYSARVARRYRAIGVIEGDEILWFWVGTHSEYDKLLARL